MASSADSLLSCLSLKEGSIAESLGLLPGATLNRSLESIGAHHRRTRPAVNGGASPGWLHRSGGSARQLEARFVLDGIQQRASDAIEPDRKSTRLNSSHVRISYAVFCLKKKNSTITSQRNWRT